jgi:catechol 2,3-dioxygenase-like lactoylglutathione lyase family enzyme
MRMLALTPMLQSDDLERTERWYGELLGFRATGRAEGWLRLERDGVALMFMTHPALGAPRATAPQYVYVDDVQGLWDSLRDRVTAEWGPEEMPYGMLEFAILDPDGYRLSFGQPVAAPAAPLESRA